MYQAQEKLTQNQTYTQRLLISVCIKKILDNTVFAWLHWNRQSQHNTTLVCDFIQQAGIVESKVWCVTQKPLCKSSVKLCWLSLLHRCRSCSVTLPNMLTTMLIRFITQELNFCFVWGRMCSLVLQKLHSSAMLNNGWTSIDSTCLTPKNFRTFFRQLVWIFSSSRSRLTQCFVTCLAADFVISLWELGSSRRKWEEGASTPYLSVKNHSHLSSVLVLLCSLLPVSGLCCYCFTNVPHCLFFPFSGCSCLRSGSMTHKVRQV